MTASTSASGAIAGAYEKNLQLSPEIGVTSVANPLPAMKRDPQQPQSTDEQDALWDLLAKAPTRKAGPYFAQKTTRMAMETPQTKPWWVGWWTQPLAVGGLVAACAAVALTASGLFNTTPQSGGGTITQHQSPQAQAIQEIAETEMLIAASDDLSEFTDQELVALIGF